jgi:hypothetical protein
MTSNAPAREMAAIVRVIASPGRFRLRAIPASAQHEASPGRFQRGRCEVRARDLQENSAPPRHRRPLSGPNRHLRDRIDRRPHRRRKRADRQSYVDLCGVELLRVAPATVRLADAPVHGAVCMATDASGPGMGRRNGSRRRYHTGVPRPHAFAMSTSQPFMPQPEASLPGMRAPADGLPLQAARATGCRCRRG